MNSGWIKLHRKILDWEWFDDSYTVHLFIHILFSANFKDKKWRGMTIKRGQFVAGRKSLSDSTGISEQTIRTSLKKLKSTNEITIKVTNRYSIITVCNYDDYQSVDLPTNQPINQPANQQLTSNQPAINQQLTTTKKDKNIRKKEEEGGKEYIGIPNTKGEIKPPPPEDDSPELQFPPKPELPATQPMSADEKEICHAWARAKNLPGMEALPSRELSHLSQHLGRLLSHFSKAEILAEIEDTLRTTAGWWINDLMDRASQSRASPGSDGMSDAELLADFRAMDERDGTYARSK